MRAFFNITCRYKAVRASKKAVLFFVLLFLVFINGFVNKNAHAICMDCQSIISSIKGDIWEEARDEFDDKLADEFERVQKFIIEEMWERTILPSMMLAADEFTAVAMHQVMIIGKFIDAESQMEAQRMLQVLRAQTHKDYHPSVGMCEFGSVMKSVAATDIRSDYNAVSLSQRSIRRQLGNTEMAGIYGLHLDEEPRLVQFKETYCNEKTRNTGLSNVCAPSVLWSLSSFDAEQRETLAKDIDYFNLIDAPWTLGIDLTNRFLENTSVTPEIHNQDEEHLWALSANLFGYDTFPRIPATLLTNRPERPISRMQRLYLDMRAIVAKRSVAENSLYAIAGLKSESSRNMSSTGVPEDPMSSRQYMEHILEELGVPDTEVLDVLGENPSYHAQMEILTKKLYQNPDFYTNLYDKPANVARKATAMQAIQLMQKFDMLKSMLRGEASVSVLLELAVVDLQKEIENQVRAMEVGQ